MKISKGIKLGLLWAFILSIIFTFFFLGSISCILCIKDAFIIFFEFYIPLSIVFGFIGWFVDRPTNKTPKPTLQSIFILIIFIISLILLISSLNITPRRNIPLGVIVSFAHIVGVSIAFRTIRITQDTNLKLDRMIGFISLIYFIPLSLYSIFILIFMIFN